MVKSLLDSPSLGIDSELPAAFAFWGSKMLIFTDKALVRYDLKTGMASDPEALTVFPSSIIGAASPPCATAL